MVIHRESDYNLRLVSGRAKDTAVFKFMIIFKHPHDIESFENTYNDLLALVERMPDVRRRQVIHVVGSPQGQSPYYRILEVYFDDSTALQASLLSAPGQEAGGELAKFPAESFEMIFAEVYEEAGASTTTAGA